MALRWGGVLLAAMLCRPLGAHAEAWRAQLWNEGLPPHLVAVDKARQSFMFFEKKSPLRLKYAFPCATGQIAGDKQTLNDLRTPEGVYFVEYKIASGLDFKEYGGIAYTLNYPNPVDRLRGKTGHGIWIHSKGFGIVPTRGCVVIGLRDIGEVGPLLTPGTAVVLAEHLDEKAQPRPDNGTARELRRLMQSWSNAWAARSAHLFDFYDQAAYSAATEPFSAFRSNKERLFKMLRFVKIYNRKIHVLEGPGYWVTWSEQLYTASNLSTEGIRRLYWQRGKDRKFRIVGMEWTPRNLGMEAAYRKGQLVAEALPAATDASSEAPRPPRLDMPESPAEAAPPPRRDGLDSGGLLAFTDPLVPRPSPTPQAPPAEVNWNARPAIKDRAAPPPLPPGRPAGGIPEVPDTAAPAQPQPPEAAILPANPTGSTAAPAQPQTPEAEARPQRDATAEPARDATTPQAAPAREALGPEDAKAVARALDAWYAALAARSGAAVTGLYDQAHFNKVKDVPRGPGHAASLRALDRHLRAPWLRVAHRNQAVALHGAVAETRSEHLITTPAGQEQGTLSLWWRKGEDGAFRIVASQFRPMELGMAAIYLESVGDEVSDMVERWRQAWERGDLDAYMAFYADDAYQQGRRGAAAIRRQKEDLWRRVRPARVRLSNLRLAVDRRGGMRADVTQDYEDSAGHADHGVKTMLLCYDGRQWRIAREDWAAALSSGRPAVGNPPAQSPAPAARRPARPSAPAAASPAPIGRRVRP